MASWRAVAGWWWVVELGWVGMGGSRLFQCSPAHWLLLLALPGVAWLAVSAKLSVGTASRLLYIRPGWHSYSTRLGC